MATKSPNTYAQVMSQISRLQAEADRLRKSEIEGVVARIKEAIATYGLTPQDLFPRDATASPRKSRGNSSSTSRAKKSTDVKFRDASGNVWGGRGPRPKWLRAALAAGRKLEEFAA